MAVDRKQQMKEITERLEQGVKGIFTSEMYTTYLRSARLWALIRLTILSRMWQAGQAEKS